MWNKDRRRVTEWGKNLLIILLTLSAIYLMSRSNLGISLRDVLWKGDGRTDLSHSQKAGQEDQRVWPVRMAVQNEDGRYGVQYDEGSLEELFSGQLGNLLGELLGTTQRLTEVPETVWREVILSGQAWVYYDFLGSVPLSRLSGWLNDEGGPMNQNLTGQVRAFLLTEAEEQKVLYCYRQDQNLYYRCEVEQALSEGGGRLSTAVSQYLPNEMLFAMEEPARYGILWPYEMILPKLPELPAYEVSNPLEDLEEEREQLLLDLSFLPKVATEYSSADESVIREGADTLRILNNGTITFTAHSADSAQARYPVELWSVDQAVEESKSILDAVLAHRIGEARSYCMRGEELDDGRIRVTFGYLLSGAQVQVGGNGWAAEFLLRDGYVESFTVHLRQYESLGTSVAVLPQKQALAALAALDKEGSELLLCYTDNGDGTVGADWFAR